MSFLKQLQNASAAAEEIRKSKRTAEEEQRGRKVFGKFKRDAEAAAKDGQRSCVAMKLKSGVDYEADFKITPNTEIVTTAKLGIAAGIVVDLLRQESLIPRWHWMTDEEADDRGLGGAPGDYYIIVHW